MRSAEAFVFDAYAFDPSARRIELHYRFDDDLAFTETITLPADLPVVDPESADLDRALFALHLIGGVSYYKALLPRRLVVRSGRLDARQAAAWNTIYTSGLGEFFYRNSIDFRGLIAFPVDTEAPAPLPPPAPAPTWRRGLVPWGGGKDSVVTRELLRTGAPEAGLTLFRLGAHHFVERSTERAGLPMLTLERAIDPGLFALNAEGAYNGHVPITTYMTFLTVVTALLGGWDSVFFSSERSADFGNIDHLGLQVNHQWSKSQEAEHLLRDYLRRYVTGGVDFVNPLRPLSELDITRRFAEYDREHGYLDVVSSCNTNWRILDQDPDREPWCGHCPKCAFVFVMLSAFVPADRLTAVFGRNLFDDPALLPLFRELWGGEGFKPFECVGTPDEVRAALGMAQRDPGYADTVVGRGAQAEALTGVDVELLRTHAFTPDWAGVPASVRHLVEGPTHVS